MMFESNNLFMKSGSLSIDGKFFNSWVHSYGDGINLLGSVIPKNEILHDDTRSGSECQRTKVLSISKHKNHVIEQIITIFHETSPFYVEEPDRKKAKLRIIRWSLK